MVIEVIRRQFGRGLEFGQAVVVIFRQPERDAEMVMGRREIGVQDDGFLEVVKRFGTAADDGEQEPDVIFRFGCGAGSLAA